MHIRAAQTKTGREMYIFQFVNRSELYMFIDALRRYADSMKEDSLRNDLLSELNAIEQRATTKYAGQQYQISAILFSVEVYAMFHALCMNAVYENIPQPVH